MWQKSKTQNVAKIKNWRFYKTQQLKYNKTERRKKCDKTKQNQFLTNLIRLHCERKKTHKVKIVRKILNLKLLQNSNKLNCNNTQKLELGLSSTQFKKKYIYINFDKIKQLKLW